MTWGVLVLWNLARSEGGIDAHQVAAVIVLAVMSAMLAFWIGARFTKKSRRWASA